VEFKVEFKHFNFMQKLNGKRILIIGGSSGLGFSAAHAFLNEGALVLCVGRNLETLIRAKHELGAGCEIYCGDAAKPETSLQAVQLAVSVWGGLDGLYHVAGGSGRKWGDGPLDALSEAGWDYTLDLNLKSVYLSNQAALRHWLEVGSAGSILNMGSVLGVSPSPKFFSTHAYAAAKSAIIGMTRSIAAYYAKSNIRANVLAPALVETPMAQRAAENQEIMSFIQTKQPLDGGRIGCPADLDEAAVYFMSDGSRFTTGQTLYVDGGWALSEGQYLSEK
jgi:NAD(P)-dependent dehydrogenase (short-subunit alcohol dehydrogenase family)